MPSGIEGVNVNSKPEQNVRYLETLSLALTWACSCSIVCESQLYLLDVLQLLHGAALTTGLLISRQLMPPDLVLCVLSRILQDVASRIFGLMS